MLQSPRNKISIVHEIMESMCLVITIKLLWQFMQLGDVQLHVAGTSKSIIGWKEKQRAYVIGQEWSMTPRRPHSRCRKLSSLSVIFCKQCVTIQRFEFPSVDYSIKQIKGLCKFRIIYEILCCVTYLACLLAPTTCFN